VKTIPIQDGRAESLARITYKIKEAAEIVGVSQISIRRAIKDGRLKVCRTFRHPLIPADQLRKMVEVS
jgi:excisionase family DNA binding protein